MKPWCKVYFKNSNSMKEVEDGSVQLAIVAPADIARWLIEMQPKLPQKKWDLLFPGYYFGFQCFRNLFLECQRVLKSDGVLLFNMGISNKDYSKAFNDNRINCLFPYIWVVNILSATSFKIQEEFIWVKSQEDEYEHFFMFTKSNKWKTCQPPELSKIWFAESISPIIHGEIVVTPFSEEIMKNLIMGFTEKGDIVLDPLAGTGTLAKVATELGRNCILYEIDDTLKPIIKSKVGEALIEDPIH